MAEAGDNLRSQESGVRSQESGVRSQNNVPPRRDAPPGRLAILSKNYGTTELPNCRTVETPRRGVWQSFPRTTELRNYGTTELPNRRDAPPGRLAICANATAEP
jgi:hypothetical protein